MSTKPEESLDPILARWYQDLTQDHQERKPGLWRLPPEHAFAHHYCFFLNDTLGRLIREAEANSLFAISINLERLTPEMRQEFQKADLSGEELFSWMETHGYQDEINDLVERQVIGGVVADAAQFIYEALRCSEKGKLAVTFALLRKPLRENLLLLELLLTDRVRFLDMLANDTEGLGIYSLPKSQRAMPIIENAVKMIGWENSFDPEFLYDLRYAKHKHFSLEPVWSKAMHLVTSGKHYATESNNLNFIFSGADATESQWDDLYRKLPTLLFYFVEVVVALLKRVVGPDRVNDATTSQARQLGFALAGYLQLPKRPFGTSHFAEFTSDCPLCGNPILDDIEGVMEMYLHSRVTCRHCSVRLSLDGTTPPKWAITLRGLTLPVMIPIRRAYRAIQKRLSDSS